MVIPMRFSETCDQLVKTLADMQHAMPMISKARKGNRGLYAGLPDTWAELQPEMKKYGLLYTQGVNHVNGDHYVLTTRIIHAGSGQWFESDYPLAPGDLSPQGVASANTYARRYGLFNALGLVSATDDDDAMRAQTDYLDADKRWGACFDALAERGFSEDAARDYLHAALDGRDAHDLTRVQWETIFRDCKKADPAEGDPIHNTPQTKGK